MHREFYEVDIFAYISLSLSLSLSLIMSYYDTNTKKWYFISFYSYLLKLKQVHVLKYVSISQSQLYSRIS